MGQPLGKRQMEIAELLLKRPYDADELAKVIYKKQVTKTLQNIVWNSLSGMEARGMITEVGKTMRGFRRWELTRQGKKDMEILKSNNKIHQLSRGHNNG